MIDYPDKFFMWQVIICLFLFCLGVGALYHVGTIQRKEAAECRQKGGVPVNTRDGMLCLSKNSVLIR